MEDLKATLASESMPQEVSRFTESYDSFRRIISSLQRQYLALKEDFEAQNRKLAEANEKLTELSSRNLEANEFLNSILNSIAVGVVAVDQSGRITHFNPGASAILGLPQNQQTGRPYSDNMPVGSPAEASALRTIETGRPVESVEKLVPLADGSSVSLSVSTAVLTDRHGTPRGAVEVFQDLTRTKRMEQQIAHLNTLAALGEMAASIAHQVRNPLAGIGGFAALLERELDDSPSKKKLASNIIRGVGNLNETVNALLDYTRTQELNRADTVYSEYLHTTIEQYLNDCGGSLNGIEISVAPAKPMPRWSGRVSIDRNLMRQVFFNLFNNSIQAMNNSGRLEVAFRLVPRQTALAMYSERILLDLDETVLETTVSDTGPGVPAEIADNLFAPFVGTKSGGHGLGLSVASKIMKAHAGDILLDKSVAEGATFRILLPAKLNTATMES